MIDQHAIIDPSARLADSVHIGPWTSIGADVEIGEGTWVGPNVVIKGPAKIGAHNKIFQFASVGEDPQDKKYRGETTYLEIGDRNVIREFCSINRGTSQGGGTTYIGHDNLFMACVHVAHDCVIGNHVIFANNSALSGHVTIKDYAILSGFVGVHQYCIIGAHSFIARAAIVVKDVLPYVLVSGYEVAACGLNTEGLKRRGFSPETISALRRAYKLIYRQGLTVREVLPQLQDMATEHPEVELLIEALSQSIRGIVR